jgi:DNA mismatch repair protein MutL
MDDIYHRMACRAAVKAGNLTTPAECEKLAERILSDNDIMYCPHGRPVAIRITEKELEKQFGRIQ